MFESLFIHAGNWIGSNLPLAALAAFAWGLGSVLFSPCHLAAIPVMAAHAAGYTRMPHGDGHPDGAESGHAGHAHAHDPEEALPGAEISVLFAAGYFAAIAALGLVCALLGRVIDLEDAGEHLWFIPAGLVLLWFGASLWREHDCSRAGRVLQGLGQRLGLRARGGSLVLGVGYGAMSSGCTLAFLAPVLVLSLPHGSGTAAVMAVGFALGHCLPMALVGLAVPLMRRLVRVCRLTPHAHGPQEHHVVERRFRRAAAVVICLAALVLMLHPFFEH